MLERALDRGFAIGARHAVQVGEHEQVLLDRERHVEVVELRDDAAQRARRLRLRAGTGRPRISISPSSGMRLRREQAHRRRLAGAVGAEQADAGAFGHLEVEVVDGGQRAETLDDALEAKGGHPAQGVMRRCAVRYGQPP